MIIFKQNGIVNDNLLKCCIHKLVYEGSLNKIIIDLKLGTVIYYWMCYKGICNIKYCKYLKN